MNFYIWLLGLILMPYLLGIHLLVVPALFLLRKKGKLRFALVLVGFSIASLPLACLYVWATIGAISIEIATVVGGLAFYTGVVAVGWLALLGQTSGGNGRPPNKSLKFAPAPSGLRRTR